MIAAPRSVEERARRLWETGEHRPHAPAREQLGDVTRSVWCDRTREMSAGAKANPAKLNAKGATRKARKLQQTPKWADHRAIAEVYEQGYRLDCHVDHMIPLIGTVRRNGKTEPFVSGLHAHDNLRVARPEENVHKSNRACKTTPPELTDWITTGGYAERFALHFLR